MDFLNQKEEQLDKKPPSKLSEIIGKIKAGIGLVQLGGNATMPKISDGVITFFLFLLVEIFFMGLFGNFYWLIKLIKYLF